MTAHLRFFATALASVLCVSPASAQTDAAAELVRQALVLGHPVEGLISGRGPALAVPVPGGSCPSVGVIHPREHFRGGPRIDNYRVCDGQIAALSDVSPALPDDPELQQGTALAIRTALRYGHQSARWQSYQIDTQRLSPMDSTGCASVATTISTDGLLVAHQVGRVCA